MSFPITSAPLEPPAPHLHLEGEGVHQYIPLAGGSLCLVFTLVTSHEQYKKDKTDLESLQNMFSWWENTSFNSTLLFSIKYQSNEAVYYFHSSQKLYLNCELLWMALPLLCFYLESINCHSNIQLCFFWLEKAINQLWNTMLLKEFIYLFIYWKKIDSYLYDFCSTDLNKE